MRIHELFNSRADKRIWGMAPCEICDTPTRWCLSPYCLKCEWLVAYWRNGVVDLERALGDLPPPEVLNGDSVLLDDAALPWFNARGFYVDPLDRSRLLPWPEYNARLHPPVPMVPHWSETAVDRFRWNEQNQLERISALELSINEKD